jgi:hypothetical protein
MSLAPKAVIHINFIPGELLFDARPIWTALNSATSEGKVPTLPKELGEELGQTAIHLGTRDYMMRAALRELNASTKAIWEFVPSAIEVGSIPNTRVMRGRAVEDARDRVLLATDSSLYECRSFLDLVARFTYAMLTGIGKQPAAKQQLSTGQSVKLVERGGGCVRTIFYCCYATNSMSRPIGFSFCRVIETSSRMRPPRIVPLRRPEPPNTTF